MKKNRKVAVHLSLDYDVWLYHKTHNNKLSESVNNYLRLMMRLKVVNEDEHEIEGKLKELNMKIDVIDEERAELLVKLEHLRSERERKTREEHEAITKVNEMLKVDNPLRDIVW